MSISPAPSSPNSGAHPRIRVLAPNVINKIAAGEVVDRPAAVVKELIENAIDAGAGTIDLHLDAGGRKRICVSDDGSGMGRDDALLAIERHATSKIREVDDIENIRTLGFRGEALAALAAVSRFMLKTGLGGGAPGVELIVGGGVLRDVRAVAFPRGSVIEVRDLFFNVPARRKFLRTPATELAHVRQAFILQALAHPAIAFSMHADGRRLAFLPGGASLEERIRELFGEDIRKNLRALDYSAGGIRVRGMTGIPPAGYQRRDYQFFFVNGRPAGAPLINYALRESYQGLLPRGRHPPAILFIDTDASGVDVNVHPQKREVRFRMPVQVRNAIQEAIAASLGFPAAAAPDAASPASPPAAPLAVKDAAMNAPEAGAPLPPFDYPAVSAGIAPRPAAAAAGSAPANAGGSPKPAPPWKHARVVGQIGGLFVLLETDGGLVIMDPHAAHERVLFDRYMQAVHAGRPDSQELLMPVTVTLPPTDADALKPHLERLDALGFGVHSFGEDGFMIDAVPAGFERMPPEEWLAQLAADFRRDGGGRRMPHGPREAIVARAACRAAVKARQRLSDAEIEQLTSDLAATEMPYTCPHGRPIMIHLSFADLRQRFGR